MGMNAAMKKSTAILALSCLLLATGIGASALLFAPDASKTNVVSSGTALVGGAFEATNQDGKRVSEKDFLGKYTLFYFGYTFCPDICPAELQVISAALSEIDGASDKAGNHRPVGIGRRHPKDRSGIPGLLCAARCSRSRQGFLSHGPFQHRLPDGTGWPFRASLPIRYVR
jgi:hypothetical protein